MSWFRGTACIGAVTLSLLSVACSSSLASDTAFRGKAAGSASPLSAGPRLVKISRGSFVAHILPESHHGTRAEQDAYFLKSVLPVARRAHVLIHEAAELQAFPGSPLWGRTCLDRNRALEPSSNRLVEILAEHHRFSQFADLHRVFLESDPETAAEQFEVFLRGRGTMLNFWDVFFSVYAGLYRQAELNTAGSRTLSPKGGLLESSPARRLSASIPTLRTESIESLEELSAAVCGLQPSEQVSLMQETLDGIESIPEDLGKRSPQHYERRVILAVELMRLQQGYGTRLPRQTVKPFLTESLRVRSGSTESIQTGISLGFATDEMLLGIRNKDWVERIHQHATANRPGLLYVLGAAHLVDYDRFDGLLTLLRKRGFQVSLVR